MIFSFKTFFFLHAHRQKEIEKIRLTREAQELANIRKKIELENIENGMEAQRNEMAEKRANDLCETYLKTKNIRVSNSSSNKINTKIWLLISYFFLDGSKSFLPLVRSNHGNSTQSWQGECTRRLEVVQ